MHDELSLMSGGSRDFLGGWAASLVDSLDTLRIMGTKLEFFDAVAVAGNIDFTTSTQDTVNIFETTIRYLGVFLRAYDLSGDKRLLHLAMNVGDMLLLAFDTPNHLRITRWDWKPAAEEHRQETPSAQLVSKLGSPTLQYTRLSQLTGDQGFYDAIQRITSLFDEQQSKNKVTGLWPVVINPKEQDLTNDTGFTFGENVYQKLYKQAMAAAIDALLFRPMTPDEDDILISGDARAGEDGTSYTTEPKGQHLGCFAGAMFGLGGRLFQNDHHVDLTRKLTEGCIWAYSAMDRGIMPEIAPFVKSDSKTSSPWDENKWLAVVFQRIDPSETTHGCTRSCQIKTSCLGYTNVDDRRSILRLEAIESVFILYRITGDEKYRNAAWKMFTAIEEVSKTQFANAAIIDITTPLSEPVPKDDRMESFWLAETLKYFYLIFSDPGLISLHEFVLNTEAHPLRRPR